MILTCELNWLEQIGWHAAGLIVLAIVLWAILDFLDRRGFFWSNPRDQDRST